MKKGFTLAEVLITIGIIGIVIAMTLPILIGKYQDQVLITQSKKTFSIVSNVMDTLKFYSGGDDYSVVFANSSEEILNEMTRHIKIIQNCGTKTGCWAKETKPQKKTEEKYSFYNSHSIAKAVLLDGSTIGIQSYNKRNVGSDCLSWFDSGETDINGNPIYNYSNQCGLIFFDTNGEKGPNQYGVDTFSFIVKPDKIIQYQGAFYDAIIGNTLIYEK